MLNSYAINEITKEIFISSASMVNHLAKFSRPSKSRGDNSCRMCMQYGYSRKSNRVILLKVADGIPTPYV